MLGAAQTDAFGPVAPRPRGVGGVVGVGADAEAAEVVGPRQEPLQPVIGQVGDHGVEATGVDLAGAAVEGDPVALLDDVVAGGGAAGHGVDLQAGCPDDGGGAELAGHQGGVAGAAAAAGEDALGGEHAVHVVGFGLGPQQDDGSAVAGEPLRRVGIEHGGADRSAWGDVQTGDDHLSGLLGRGAGLRWSAAGGGRSRPAHSSRGGPRRRG